MNLYTFLALGDSYTIGEAVPLLSSFPYQTVQLLRTENINMAPPEIVAKTGWTTDELANAMKEHTFLKTYDIVTLLIGVNNQYRGRSTKEYKIEFEQLLQQAICLAGQKSDQVVVLSIPDYSVTPFAQSMDAEKINREIDVYNTINKTISQTLDVHYINITESTREAKKNVFLLAADGLHPSAAEYQKWAQLLAQKIENILR